MNKLAYDPARSLLQYEGHYILKRTQTLMDLIVTINTQLGRPASHPLKAFLFSFLFFFLRS